MELTDKMGNKKRLLEYDPNNTSKAETLFAIASC